MLRRLDKDHVTRADAEDDWRSTRKAGHDINRARERHSTIRKTEHDEPNRRRDRVRNKKTCNESTGTMKTTMNGDYGRERWRLVDGRLKSRASLTTLTEEDEREGREAHQGAIEK